MARYIDAERFEKWLEDNVQKRKISMASAEYAASLLKYAPTADVQEVRHGKWDCLESIYGDYYRCSECDMDFVIEEGTPKDNQYHFCPYCGAKMDGKDE